MINLELELRKCRERTKDEAVVKLMMQAKVDVLDETPHRDSRDELLWWVQRQAIHTNEQREIAEAAKLPKKSAVKKRKPVPANA